MYICVFMVIGFIGAGPFLDRLSFFDPFISLIAPQANINAFSHSSRNSKKYLKPDTSKPSVDLFVDYE
jgi:hypothetical protein